MIRSKVTEVPIRAALGEKKKTAKRGIKEKTGAEPTYMDREEKEAYTVPETKHMCRNRHHLHSPHLPAPSRKKSRRRLV